MAAQSASPGRKFFDGIFDHFPGFAGAFLDAAQQFFLFAFGKLEIVIGELGPFLFQFALGDVPIAFDFECGHNASLIGCWLLSAVSVAAKVNVIKRPVAGRRGADNGTLNRQRISRTTMTMTSRRPTEPPPMKIALAKRGEAKRYMIGLLVDGLFGAVLDPLAGVLHVLAKTIGRVAAQVGNRHEREEKQQDRGAFE
jgi:hypothetical protein